MIAILAIKILLRRVLWRAPWTLFDFAQDDAKPDIGKYNQEQKDYQAHA